MRRTNGFCHATGYHPARGMSEYSELPLCIHEMSPDYPLFLDYFTIHYEKITLFAVPDEKLDDCKKNQGNTLS
jgi:hypothetical protein